MRFEFRLPDIGEGMVEGEIVKWHIKKGDKIDEDAQMLDLMTDKATVTIPAPKAGMILETYGKEGEVVKVGSVLVVIETAQIAGPEKAPLPEKASVMAATPQNWERKQEEFSKILASPATRRLAQELGINLSAIAGTGPGGRVTSEDVQLFFDQSSRRAETRGSLVSTRPVGKAADYAARPKGREERIPIRGLRRKIAEKMILSKSRAPHFTYVEEADLTELTSLRGKVEPAASAKGVRLTYLPFIVKAVVQAIKKYPVMNSILDEEKQEIVLKHYYNIGIGAATPEGLTVFVIRDADQKSILQLAKEIQDLGERAKAGRLSLDELQGSTFTITSLGPLGGILATPIINYPEVAILGVHRIHKRPVVRDNHIVIRDMAYLSLSFDHRVIDGDVGARFAIQVIEYLQSPALPHLEQILSEG